MPGVGLVHDDWLLYAPKEDQWQRAVKRLEPLRRIADALTGVPCTLQFDDAMRWLLVSRVILSRSRAAGWELRRHAIVHSGVDRNLFRAQTLRPWTGRLLCVGRIDPRKGVHTAIEALRELPGMRLAVVGTGDDDYLTRLTALANHCGVSHRLSFERAARRELPAIYADADAVLFPVNWEEPFGLVPLEAMAVGRPVVASGTGGSSEYLRHERNCLIYSPPDDPIALAQAVARLAGDCELRARLCAGGLETAAAHGEERFTAAVQKELEAAARGVV
jgi:glycosyltransferase involved in cell wall biosynthesis